MKTENIDVSATINKAKIILSKDKKTSPSVVAMMELLITIISILLNQINTNSRNSSKPPSQDPNRSRKGKGEKRGEKKPGAQTGHIGAHLKPVKNPDEIEKIFIDRRTLPIGNYKSNGFEKRQVFNIKISSQVIEYQAEILKDQNGDQWVADFPSGVNNPTQYSGELKAHSVYMSQFQLIPQLRISDYFNDQLKIPLSKGSVQNFNKTAFNLLEDFENWAKGRLLSAKLNHADETGVNVNGKKFWIHLLSNPEVTLCQVDKIRGSEAMNKMGILPSYTGILCHDHWKAYYKYCCTHSLCNAHHLRELEGVWERDSCKWAKEMKALLEKINREVHESRENRLSKKRIFYYEKKYRAILKRGDLESPLFESKTTKRRIKQTKSRNLLDRLRDFEEDTLRFMKESLVPFTNNRAENDLRMTKVQQKISGCFRSIDGAKIFCRIRSYLITCRKNGVNPTEALNLLFQGKLPKFMT